ncbi:mannitol dehydrogenase family protein [Leptolyngbya sp. AN03gr2]|uniref:mannitol dehydrogenase family protein n=1 Tax=unclassified Leptolyngbya TaxID=2650499 RepID=UPI003D311955
MKGYLLPASEFQNANKIAVATVPELWNQQPPYNRGELKTGIVHFGPGRFFRAHLARIIHKHLAQKDPRWGICGVSLKSRDAIATLQPQNFLYTLVERYDGDEQHESADIIGSINQIINGAENPNEVLELMASPSVQMVTLTVTQAGYCLDSRFNLNTNCDEIAHDLDNPTRPTTVIGFIVEALRRRRDRNLKPLTILSCDNLPKNGDILQRAVLTYAEQLDPALVEHIANQTSFPNTVVDQIVPRQCDSDCEYPRQLLNVHDVAPIVTEPFWQFVVEDKFSSDRPSWEDTGVTMTDNIDPFLYIKSRLLNAVHTFIACLAVEAEIEYVHQVLRLPEFHLFLRSLMDDIAAATPVDYQMCEQYIDRVLLRLSNEALPDAIERIATETSRKLGKYIVPILQDAYIQEINSHRLILPIAAWMLAVQESKFNVQDRSDVISAIRAGASFSQALGLERNECSRMLDRECDRALREIRSFGLSATLRHHNSEEHFQNDIAA